MRSRSDVALAGLLVASCSVVPTARPAIERGQHADQSTGTVKIGHPYSVAGKRYVPSDDRDYDEVGLASWYGEELRGSATANGETFDPLAMSAAHRTLPMPSFVTVTALDSGRTITVRVNDRGPFHGDRVIDLSLAAARALGMTGGGAQRVRVRRVYPDDDDRRRIGTARAPVNATAMPATSDDGAFFVQVASFTSEDRARNLAQSLDGRVVRGDGVYRVRLGPFRDAATATAALAPLADRGYPGAIVTR